MPTIDLTRIGSNIGALYSLQSLLDINNKLASTQQRLSTGKRINSAADDPAGLVIATKMHARSEGLRVVEDNISDATNMMSVAEAGLNQVTDIVTQMRSKATQAANDTLGQTERAAIQTQLSQFSAQIDDILKSTKWNGTQLLSGALSKQFQTGVDMDETTTWNMNTNLTSGSGGLGLSKAVVQSTVTAEGVSIPASGTLGNLSELSTGDYTVSAEDKATSDILGKTNLLSNNSSMTLDHSSAQATATGANVMSSGQYALKITNVVSATDISYTLTKTGDASFGTNGVLTVNHANLNNTGTARSVTPLIPNRALTGVSLSPMTIGSGTAGAEGELTNGTYTVILHSWEGTDTIFGSADDIITVQLNLGGSILDISDDISGNGNGTAPFISNPGLPLSNTYDTGRGVRISFDKSLGIDGSSINTTFTYTRAIAGAAAGDLVDSSGSTLGVNIGTNLGSLKAGDTMNYEYIAQNEAKMFLRDSDGLAKQIAQNASGTLTGQYAYVAAGTNHNFGRGVTAGPSSNIFDPGVSGVITANFSYEQANAYSVNLSTAANAASYMSFADTALDTINTQLANLGSLMARMRIKQDAASMSRLNVEAAYNRIMNANMAEEQVNASKYKVLQQTSVAMLAQSNMAPQAILSLFK